MSLHEKASMAEGERERIEDIRYRRERGTTPRAEDVDFLLLRLAAAQKDNERLRKILREAKLYAHDLDVVLAATHEDRERPCEHGIAFGEFCPRCPGGGV